MSVYKLFFDFMMQPFTILGYTFSLWHVCLFEILGCFGFWFMMKIFDR